MKVKLEITVPKIQMKTQDSQAKAQDLYRGLAQDIYEKPDYFYTAYIYFQCFIGRQSVLELVKLYGWPRPSPLGAPGPATPPAAGCSQRATTHVHDITVRRRRNPEGQRHRARCVCLSDRYRITMIRSTHFVPCAFRPAKRHCANACAIVSTCAC